jgi:hypothetical protein
MGHLTSLDINLSLNFFWLGRLFEEPWLEDFLELVESLSDSSNSKDLLLGCELKPMTLIQDCTLRSRS